MVPCPPPQRAALLSHGNDPVGGEGQFAAPDVTLDRQRPEYTWPAAPAHADATNNAQTMMLANILSRRQFALCTWLARPRKEKKRADFHFRQDARSNTHGTHAPKSITTEAKERTQPSSGRRKEKKEGKKPRSHAKTVVRTSPHGTNSQAALDATLRQAVFKKRQKRSGASPGCAFACEFSQATAVLKRPEHLR